MCQDCLTATLPIVSPSLCLLLRFLANNGNGRLTLDGYFVHQQSVIQHLQRWRALSVNLWTIRTLNSWTLSIIATGHRRVCLLCRKPIDWLRTACKIHAAEWRKPLKNMLHGCRAIYHSAQGAACVTVAGSSLRNCSTCLRKVRTYIYIYIVISRMGRDHQPHFAH